MERKKKVSNIYGQVYGFAKETVTCLEQLYPGDHLAYERVKLYWHHVIVEDIDSETNEIKVIHYYNNVKEFFETTLSKGSLAQVTKGTLKFWSRRFSRIVYDEEEAHPPDKVLELAYGRLGETAYNPLTANCEHFCTYCKIGKNISVQVEVLVENALATVLPPLARVLLEELLKKTVEDSIKQLSSEIVKKVGQETLKRLPQVVFQIAVVRCVGFVGSRSAWVVLQQNTARIVKDVLMAEVKKFSKTSAKEVVKAAARNIPSTTSGKQLTENSTPKRPNCRMTKSGVLAGVAIEIAFVGKDIRDAAVKKKAGEITKDEFEETVIKRVLGASVSAPMSVAGSVVGQYVLPIPVVGNVIGGITGSAAGKVVGAVVSSTVIKTKNNVRKFWKSFSWKRN